MLTTLISRVRPWLPFVAAVLVVVAAVPPVGTYAGRFAVARAAQFVVFAVIAPALLASGWPARWPDLPGPWPEIRRAHAGQAGVRATASLLPFAALVIVWRLPTVLTALDRDPALTIAELVTLAGAGTAVWLELTAGLTARRPLPRPLRAAMAAVAMWTIWVVAYITGMSGVAAAPVRAGALSAAADRQLAVAVLWAVPAICLAPVVYTIVVRWLGDRDGQDPTGAASGSPGHAPGSFVNSPRPPRGWRS
ncbi:MAG TPA: cytochrome c oxidase assembly protein [Streptosporangiaceae bacterium]|nr:cytochrome c oxidase assembly protein [Streptosporangiaceae bacterium]